MRQLVIVVFFIVVSEVGSCLRIIGFFVVADGAEIVVFDKIVDIEIVYVHSF